MLFARPPKPKKSPLNPQPILAGLISRLQESVPGNTVRIELTADPSCPLINADESQFNSLMSYLIRNAIEAVKDSAAPGHVDVKMSANPAYRALEVSVSDSIRRPISATELRHMFDPFYSGRAAGRGLGFGLSLAWQIVRQHAGILFCFAPAAGGLQAHVALPQNL